jgi:GNAT superfamily N-acetyltransferase
MPLDEEIRRFVEEPDAQLPDVPPPARRIIRPDFILTMGPSSDHVVLTRLRVEPDALDATISEVRAVVRDAGFVSCVWYLGPACRPIGVVKLLAARGFRPSTQALFEPEYTAMLLMQPPDAPPAPGVEARLVRDFDEYVSALRVGLIAAGASPQNIAAFVQAAPAYWQQPGGAAKHTHIAFADGEVAGLGFVAPGHIAMLLGGGAVLPQFRRRGVYRALISSRWRAALEAGKPMLAVHAGAMSRPILERCGFHSVCRFDVLEDPSFAAK